jgi:hypothetical protein
MPNMPASKSFMKWVQIITTSKFDSLSLSDRRCKLPHETAGNTGTRPFALATFVLATLALATFSPTTVDLPTLF